MSRRATILPCLLLAMVVPAAASPRDRTQSRSTHLPAPRVIGTMRVGGRVWCNHGPAGGPTPETIDWLRDGRTILTIGSRSLVLVAEDRDHRIACSVAWPAAYGRRQVTSRARRFWVRPGVDRPPRVSAGLRAGRPTTCERGVWRWSPWSYRYRWIVDGRPTQDHGPVLPPVEARFGATVTCLVTASNPAGSHTAMSASVRLR